MRAAFVGLALALAACTQAPPNLLLVTIDTLRADHVTAYGYRLPTTPHIDRLAQQGVLFEELIAPRGATWPALTTLLTSQHPRIHGVRDNGMPMPADLLQLPEYLAAHGYETAAFLTNMTEAGARFGEAPSFAVHAKDRQATRAAIAYLRRERSAPFFAWLHLMGPHQPYWNETPPPAAFDTGYRGPLDGKLETLQRIHRERRDLSPDEVAHIVSLYDADVSFVDQHVGELMGALEEAGLAGDTLVALAADHGEELYQHNHFFMHAWSIYESVLHVPWILRLPGRLPAGTRVPGVVAMADLAPTLLELLGLPVPAEFSGQSLAALATGRAAPEPEGAVFSELGPEIYSVRTERWHYLHNPLGLSSPGTQPGDHGDERRFTIAVDELYAVRDDPQEKNDLSARHPEVVAELRARLEAWLAATRGRARTGAVELTPERRRMLEELGYLE